MNNARPNEAELRAQVAEFLRSRPGGEQLLLTLSIPTILAGSLYGVIQFELRQSVSDVAFIVMLALATSFLSVGALYIRRLLCRSAVLLFLEIEEIPEQASHTGWKRFLAIYGRIQEPGQLLQRVFARGPMALWGGCYGLVLASAPFVLSVHEGSGAMQGSLSLFLFAANAVTGAALYSMVVLLRQSWYLARRLKISYFQRRTASTAAYARLLASVSVIGAIYIGTCQVSIVFSEFSGAWVYGYAIFAVFVFVSLYYVPQAPIRRRLREERRELLDRIDSAKEELLKKDLASTTPRKILDVFEMETEINRMGLGISARGRSIVIGTAVASGLMPFLFAVLTSLVQTYFK